MTDEIKAFIAWLLNTHTFIYCGKWGWYDCRAERGTTHVDIDYIFNYWKNERHKTTT